MLEWSTIHNKREVGSIVARWRRVGGRAMCSRRVWLYKVYQALISLVSVTIRRAWWQQGGLQVPKTVMQELEKVAWLWPGCGDINTKNLLNEGPLASECQVEEIDVVLGRVAVLGLLQRALGLVQGVLRCLQCIQLFLNARKLDL